jgi:hypothetical protein
MGIKSIREETKMTAKNGYTCGTSRDVRGNCGHTHRTLSGAVRCLRDDRRGCKSQGGYSDRAIHAVVDGRVEDLDEQDYYTAQNGLN